MFCGASGVTKAHIFAESWTKMFDEPDDAEDHAVVHEYIDPGTGKKRELKRAKTFALTSRNVCGRCNSGWLNQVEDKVKPLMACFAANTPVTLDSEEQAGLALWAFAAALIAMRGDPAARDFADPALARELYRTRRPPDGLEIWLGANSHGHMGWFGSYSLKIPTAPGRTEAWGASISFGYVVIHMVLHGLHDQRMNLRRDAARALRRIWETSDRVDWPPKVLIGPRDLTPLVTTVSEQSSFERAAPSRRGRG